MADSVIKIGDKYYRKTAGNQILNNLSFMSGYSDGLGDYLRNHNCIKDSLVEYFNEKEIGSEKVDIMSDELSSMIINIINMTLKLSFEPINKVLEEHNISEEEVYEILRTNKVREEAKKFRDKFKDCNKIQCKKCKQFIKFEDIELDHIIPVAEGGSSDPSNLQFLCHKCHMEKHHGVKED